MTTTGYFDAHTQPIDQRVATGLYKLGLAVKHQERSHALDAGLSPTQAQILTLLSQEGATTASELSSVLGVSLPTVSDSVSALVGKGLVEKQPATGRTRASLLTLSRAGRALAQRTAAWPEFLAPAVGTLSDAQQESLLSILVMLLRTLQENGQIPTQRMCLTCVFFRPNAHAGPRPHHCAFVDAPMAAAQLRFECDEHEVAPQERQTAQWEDFLKLAV